MTTDELIAKLLDDTLTADEHSQLQAMIAESPELAEEIRHLRTIEDMLTRPLNEPTQNAAPFLQSVEDKIAVSLVAAGGAASVARMSTMPRTFVISMLALAGSIGVFFIMHPEAEQQQPVAAATQTELPPSFEMPVPAAATHNTARSTTPASQTARPRSAPARSTPRAVTSAQEAMQPATVQRAPEAASATINRPPVPLSTLRAIEQHLADYDKAMNSGNTLQAIVPAYRLGMLYKSVGDSRAVDFMEKTREISREKNQPKYEAISLGELGLMAREKGNTEIAASYLHDCLSILEQLNDEKLLKEWREKAAR